MADKKDVKVEEAKMAKEDVKVEETKVEEVVETTEEQSDIVKELSETQKLMESWKPKTELGLKVKNGEITDIDEILTKGKVIAEGEIVDVLFPGLVSELLLVGQAKGKFGGGQRRIFRQTQKKTKEGNVISFVSCAACGTEDGYVGVGFGKSKETVPSKDKAIRSAKMNMIKIRRGCGSWECHCGGAHSIPYAVEGKCGSVRIKLIPAPKGKGLVVNAECAKILKLAGITDVWSKVQGQTKCRLNVIKACFNAIEKLTKVKIPPKLADQILAGNMEG